MPLCTVEEALNDIRLGKIVILCGDEDRENEGDLTMGAEKVTPEAINFMAKYGRGLVCLSLCEEKLKQLGLPLMVKDNTSPFSPAFTVSIDARRGVTTGISAYDRATTILAAIADDARPQDFTRPGHIFPLQTRRGGVLKRTGQVEGSVDLARLAGLKPAGVICGIMRDDGTMARMPDLERLAAEHNLKIVTVANVINYRIQKEQLVKRVVTATLPTYYGGDFKLIVYESEIDNAHHMALIKGEWDINEPVLTRVHSECLLGEVLGSKRCDCGAKLHAAMKMIQREGKGVILYMRQEAPGMDLVTKCKRYALQDDGYNVREGNEALSSKAQLRDYGVGAQILGDLGVRRLRIMTNNLPKKVVALQGYGLIIEEQVPLEVTS
ncbi:MAG: 3,4-dihydroxy-2-butanone-4-phosphate synthase [Pseudomonadota bacterium]